MPARPPRQDRRAATRRAVRVLVALGAVLAAALGLAACSTWMPGRSFRGPLPPLDARERAYEGELRAHVRALAEGIGERNLQHPEALEKALVYLEDALRASGYTPRRLGYEVAGRTVYNLEVERRGGARANEIVIVGGHYDSIEGSPAADDNASGAAATLALARAFAGASPARTLRFVAFVNEEPPHFWTESMGSLVYARACRARGDAVVAMLSLETMAYFTDEAGSQRYPFPFSLFYPSTGNFIGFVGDTASGDLTRSVVGGGRAPPPHPPPGGGGRGCRAHATIPSEGVAAPGSLPGVGWSDQWAFWQNGYPAVMVTDTAPFRNPHYHTAGDTPGTLDHPRFARVVAGLERVVAGLANP
jgi:hypothetical protein